MTPARHTPPGAVQWKATIPRPLAAWLDGLIPGAPRPHLLRRLRDRRTDVEALLHPTPDPVVRASLALHALAPEPGPAAAALRKVLAGVPPDAPVRLASLRRALAELRRAVEVEG